MKKYHQNVYLLYGIVFFHNLIPAYVIERLFWQERGMTVLMVVFCEMIYALTIVIGEIPTGILADKIGRKALLFVGGILSFLEVVILLFAHSFWAFGFAVFLAGIATACISGSANALLYDTLLAEKSAKSFEKIIGRTNSFDIVAAILAALLGSVLGNSFQFELNYIVSACSMFIALFLTFFLEEPPLIEDMTKKDVIHLTIFEYTKRALQFFIERPKILSVIIHAMAVSACITYLDEFWQLYLNEIGVSILFFGAFSTFILLVRIPGNLLAAYLMTIFKAETIILAALVVTTIGFFMTALFPGQIGLIAIIAIFLASGTIEPIVTGYLHHHCPSQIRATVASFQSLIERVISFTIGLGFGYVATTQTLVSGFSLLGIISFVFTFTFILYIKKQHQSIQLLIRIFFKSKRKQQ